MGTLTFDVAVTGRVNFTDRRELNEHGAHAVIYEHLNGINPDWSLADGLSIHEVAVNDRRASGQVVRIVSGGDADCVVAFMLTLHAEGKSLGEAVHEIQETLSREYLGDPEPDEGDIWYPACLKLWGLRLDGRHKPMLVFAHGDDDDPDTPYELNVDLTDMAEPHACDECKEIYDEACGDGYAGKCPACADAG